MFACQHINLGSPKSRLRHRTTPHAKTDIVVTPTSATGRCNGRFGTTNRRDRDGGQCTHVDGWIGRCPETTNLHYDHRYVPFRLGGPQEMWNLTLLCAEHNHAKGGEVQW